MKKLRDPNEGLSIPRRLKNFRKVMMKIGRLQERYKMVSHLHEVTVTQMEDSDLAESITVTKRVSYGDRTLAGGG